MFQLAADPIIPPPADRNSVTRQVADVDERVLKFESTTYPVGCTNSN
jgi:hypothetical protein